MTRLALAAVVLVSAAVAAAADAETMIRPPAAREPLGVVTHIDVLPEHATPAKDAISTYVTSARCEPGALRIEAMQEIRGNHFDLVEAWRDEEAYHVHEASPATVHFRRTVGPWLGSPLDERIGTPVGR